MEWFLLGCFVLFLLVGPWIFILVLRNRLHQQGKFLDTRLSDFARRLYEMESTLRDLKRSEKRESAPSPEPQPITPKVEQPTPPPSMTVAEPPKPKPAAPITPTPATPPREVLPPLPSTPLRTPAPEPIFPASATFSDKIREGGGIEEVLGKNWLNKLGIVLLVIGIAFFLAFQLKTLGPAGKVLVGYSVSLALLVSGIWFERSDKYRILARAGIAGGWALLFFTTYAMYHVPATHVLSSQLVDLVLMLIVALTMVWHTLRYNSQVVTALAFLLAFSTVFISRVSVYSLTAGAVLALGIAIIAVRRSWFPLEIFGIIATYLNHFYWLQTIIEPMQGAKHAFPEFFPSAAILICYWAIYRASYVARKVESTNNEGLSTFAALLNTASLLALLKYQSIHPEWAFWVMLAFGAAEFALGQLPITRRRHTAFIVLTTIGTAMLVAALPFRYSGARVSILWLLEAETLFLVGVWTTELVFSRLGVLAAFLTAGQMIVVNGLRTFETRASSGLETPDYRNGLLVLGLAAIVNYANVYYMGRRWRDFFANAMDEELLDTLSYFAAALATVSLWMVFPDIWTAVAWSTLGLALAIASSRIKSSHLAVQASLLSTAALLRIIVVNFSSTREFHHISLRVVTVGTVAALYYLTSHWAHVSDRPTTRRLGDAYTWTASILLAVLMWYELDANNVALAWTAFGALLFESGAKKLSASLRWQGYTALFAGFVRIFFVNLVSPAHPYEFTPRAWTVAIIAVIFFYVYARKRALPRRSHEATVLTSHAWLGSITLTAILNFELPADWTVTGWALLALSLIVVAFVLKLRTFTQQAIATAAVVFLRALFYNFVNRGPQPWTTSSIAVIGASAAIFTTLWFAFQLRQTDIPNRNIEALWLRPEQPLFFLPLTLITILLALEMRSGLITVSWGIEAVVVFLFALAVAERTYRLAGLALLLLCVGKIILIDVWGLEGRDRYITLIIMGCALLLVSFLYTRYRDTIKQYL